VWLRGYTSIVQVVPGLSRYHLYIGGYTHPTRYP